MIGSLPETIYLYVREHVRCSKWKWLQNSSQLPSCIIIDVHFYVKVNGATRTQQVSRKLLKASWPRTRWTNPSLPENFHNLWNSGSLLNPHQCAKITQSLGQQNEEPSTIPIFERKRVRGPSPPSSGLSALSVFALKNRSGQTRHDWRNRRKQNTEQAMELPWSVRSSKEQLFLTVIVCSAPNWSSCVSARGKVRVSAKRLVVSDERNRALQSLEKITMIDRRGLSPSPTRPIAILTSPRSAGRAERRRKPGNLSRSLLCPIPW